jgi:hydroxymethylpyrimidine/phosphomethylpyrimidine kinase
MLGSADVARAVVQGIRDYAPSMLVVDPVMVATSGDLLLADDAIALVRDELIPLAHVVAPNLDEARVLLGTPIRTQEEMMRAAEALVTQLGARAALVKGGHLDGPFVVDVLYDGDWHVFRNVRLNSRHTHGTGCTLSAAIAAHLALGQSLLDSINAAIEYVHHAIATAPTLGSGHGPLNHFA